MKRTLILLTALFLVACGPAPKKSAEPAKPAPSDRPTPAPVGDGLLADTDYDAIGRVPCSMGGEQAGNCEFAVKREGNGSGMVTVTKLDGRTRTIFFEDGRATGYDAANQSESGEFRAEKKGDRNIVRIGDERYQIRDVVIYGG